MRGFLKGLKRRGMEEDMSGSEGYGFRVFFPKHIISHVLFFAFFLLLYFYTFFSGTGHCMAQLLLFIHSYSKTAPRHTKSRIATTHTTPSLVNLELTLNYQVGTVRDYSLLLTCTGIYNGKLESYASL